MASNAQYDSGLQVVRPSTPPSADKQAYNTYYNPYDGGAGSTTATFTDVPHQVNIVPEKRILGLRRSTFSLAVVLVFLLAAIALVGGIFGAKIADMESRLSAVQGSSRTMPDSSGTPVDPAIAWPTETDIVVDGWTYQGCYEDGSDRTLSEDSDNSDKMTNQQCATSCRRFGYFGTQFGSQCYCGNELTRDKQVAPWHCVDHCTGAAAGAENCGGYFYLSLWKKNE